LEQASVGTNAGQVESYMGAKGRWVHHVCADSVRVEATD